MSQITIRGIDPATESKIRRLAKQSGKSLNRVILDMVYDCTGARKRDRKPAAHSLKKLAGWFTLSLPFPKFGAGEATQGTRVLSKGSALWRSCQPFPWCFCASQRPTTKFLRVGRSSRP
jgi:hypothetical protein